MHSIVRFPPTFLFIILLFFINAFAQRESADKKSLIVSPTDETTINTVITDFFKAYSKKDLPAMKLLWSAKSPFFAAHMQDVEEVFSQTERIETKIRLFDKFVIEGEKIKIQAIVEFNATEMKTNKPYEVYRSKNRFLIVVKEENDWRIFRHISAEKDLALRLIAAKIEDERNQLLQNEKDLVNVILANEFTREGNRLYGQISSSEVLDIYRLGLKVAEQLGDKKEISRALNSIGNTLSSQGKESEALEAYQKALKLNEEIDDKVMTAKLLGNIGIYYFDQSDYEKALDFSYKSLTIAEEIDEKREIAHKLSQIGRIYAIKGNYLKSLESHRKALAIREQIGELSGISVSLSNIALIHINQGNYAEALEYLGKSIKLSESVGDKYGLAIDLYNIGNIYKRQGNFAQAMMFYQRSLSLSEEIGSHKEIAAVSVNIGNLYITQGNYAQALSFLNKALSYFESIKNKYGIITALGNFGHVYYYQGQYLKAIEYRHKALTIAEEIGDKSNIILNLVQIGKSYASLGENAKALEYLQRGLTVSESLEHNEQIYQVLLEIANFNLLQKDYTKAMEAANRAKSVYQKISGLSDDAHLYFIFGQAYKGLGNQAQARQAFDKSISIIENLLPQTVGGEEERQRFFEKQVSTYYLLIDLLVLQNNFNEAFSFAERTKSRMLLDILLNGKINIAKAMDSEKRELEKRLKNEMVSLNAQISKEKDKTRLADLQNQLEKKRLEFEDFQTRLYASHPKLRIQRGEMKPISLEESAYLLPDNKTALLEYVVTNDKVFLFVISKDSSGKASLKVYPIEIKQKDLAARAESFRAKLAKGDLDFGKQAQDLYALLLKPAEAQLKNNTNLIIVPDAVLWDLPFQALETAPNKYLIETAAISYAPSLTALREMAKKNKGKKFDGATLLAFGNPTIGKETSDRIKRVFMSESLEPLPEAERLVNGLGKLYGANRSKVFVGAEAREETAKTETSKYRIVQFAAHGILNDVSPMYSHIVLARKQDNPSEDGLLEAWEMKDLNLNADLVILSACETARGRVSSGEGVIGMSWALFIAGAPTTVASQWKVESSSTTELMLEFHRQLLNGKNITKAEALRRASLKLLKIPNYKHPSYWAGFVMVGDGF